MMNWILLIMGMVVSVVTAVLVGGFLVPRQYRVARTTNLPVPAERVWEKLATVAEWPLWMERARTVQLTERTPPTLLRFALLDDARAPQAQLRVALTVVADGVRVDAQEEGQLVNPVVRLFRHYVTGHAGTLEALLQTLAADLGVTHVSVQELSTAAAATRSA
jgi:hypothetical protein